MVSTTYLVLATTPAGETYPVVSFADGLFYGLEGYTALKQAFVTLEALRDLRDGCVFRVVTRWVTS
jgi:hypothetical protein